MNGLPLGRVLVGDAATRLRQLPTNSIDCILTSPPYYGLRHYGRSDQLGLEKSVEGWVEHLLTVSDELARVLKASGSLWLNLGDSYSRAASYGAPAKSLLLAPERLLLALSGRGWLVRNKVVWAKPNPMPSSVRDRLSCTWEPLYLLTRSNAYYFDLDLIRVPHRSNPRPARTRQGETALHQRGAPDWAGPLAGDQAGLERLKAAGLPGHPLGKNPGDVWTLPTSNFRGGHHATFPEALVERPLLATCPARVCGRCRKPWRRAQIERRIGHLALLGALQPDCECQVCWQPGVVLDPFIGSGTTAVVAERLRRSWIGIELNPTFAKLVENRVGQVRSQSRRNAA